LYLNIQLNKKTTWTFVSLKYFKKNESWISTFRGFKRRSKNVYLNDRDSTTMINNDNNQIIIELIIN
jgi:regulation of enolase protein 1 (concanavalin A-like superfamily)